MCLQEIGPRSSAGDLKFSVSSSDDVLLKMNSDLEGSVNDVGG